MSLCNKLVLLTGNNRKLVLKCFCALRLTSAKPTDLDAGVVGVRLASWWVGEQNVLGFKVPVDYAFSLQDPHGPCNLLQENPNSVLTQGAFGCRGT